MDEQKPNPQKIQLSLLTCEIGAIGELIIAADLLSKGFEVHRALSAGAKFDLIALKGDQILKVQVRTGRYVNGKLFYSTKGTVPTHYAVLNHLKSTIHYIPDLVL